jgi:hypothetical protein
VQQNALRPAQTFLATSFGTEEAFANFFIDAPTQKFGSHQILWRESKFPPFESKNSKIREK